VERHRRLQQASSQRESSKQLEYGMGLIIITDAHSTTTTIRFLCRFLAWTKNAMRGGDPRAPLARKDANLGVIWSLALVGYTTPSRYRSESITELPAPKANEGKRGRADKIGIEPKGERKAAIDREITGQGGPNPVTKS
jgi:hypothetical protein